MGRASVLILEFPYTSIFDMNFYASKCRGSWLHKFSTISSTQDAVLERCVRCGKKHVIKLVKGEPNIIEYARWHQKEFLIPQHRLWGHEFQRV